MAAMEITGRRFGKLVVLRRVLVPKARNSMWACRCDCGQQKTIAGNSMTLGGVISCGCAKRGPSPLPGRKLNGKTTKEYATWSSMIQRCENQRSHSYKNYGGRGIRVCRRWLKFDAFLSDMGVRPVRGTLERRNNAKGYCKSNCRWATQQEQMWNIRTNVKITWQRETKCVGEWAKILNINPSTLNSRVFQKGWPVEKAMTQPTQKQCRLLTFNGKTQRVSAWAKATGLSQKRIDARLRRGWPIARILTTPQNGITHD